MLLLSVELLPGDILRIIWCQCLNADLLFMRSKKPFLIIEGELVVSLKRGCQLSRVAGTNPSINLFLVSCGHNSSA